MTDYELTLRCDFPRKEGKGWTFCTATQSFIASKDAASQATKAGWGVLVGAVEKLICPDCRKIFAKMKDKDKAFGWEGQREVRPY